MYKTTKKDFDEFRQSCWNWIHYFGLKGWDYVFDHNAPAHKPDAAAGYGMDYEARLVFISFNRELAEQPDKNDIKRYGFHEVVHVMLYQLSRYAALSTSESLVNQSEHEIIAILENTIFQDSL